MLRNVIVKWLKWFISDAFCKILAKLSVRGAFFVFTSAWSTIVYMLSFGDGIYFPCFCLTRFWLKSIVQLYIYGFHNNTSNNNGPIFLPRECNFYTRCSTGVLNQPINMAFSHVRVCEDTCECGERGNILSICTELSNRGGERKLVHICFLMQKFQWNWWEFTVRVLMHA